MKARWERGQDKFSRSERVHRAGVLITFRKLNMKEEGNSADIKDSTEKVS